MQRGQNKQGFTIVELLIVIVVIGILAALVISTFASAQGRARDAKRLSDAQAIVKALEAYKADKGIYPPVAHTGLGGQGGWEASAREAAGEFIAPLKPYGFTGGVPVDPINDATDTVFNDARANNRYTYSYYKYPAGANGCDTTRGGFYVLGMMRTETGGNGAHAQSPGFMCSGRNWQTDFSWVTGGYER